MATDAYAVRVLGQPRGVEDPAITETQPPHLVDVEGIEPRAKHSMRDADKDRLEHQLLEEMARHHRRAFNGPVALRLILQTSEKTPTHSPNIAKNFDLSESHGRLWQSDAAPFFMAMTAKFKPSLSRAPTASPNR